MNMKKIATLVSILAIVILVVGLSACEQLQQILQPAMPSQALAQMGIESSTLVFTRISHR